MNTDDRSGDCDPQICLKNIVISVFFPYWLHTISNSFEHNIFCAGRAAIANFRVLFTVGTDGLGRTIFTAQTVQPEASEHEYCAEPLQCRHRVCKNQNGRENGEKLARCSYDTASQRTKLGDRHEDEILHIEQS